MQEISLYFSAILCDFSLNPGNDGPLPKIPPLGIQNGGRSSRGVESTDAGVQKTEKLLYRKSCILHGYFLLGILTIPVPFIIARCAGKVNPAPLHGPLKFVRGKAD